MFLQDFLHFLVIITSKNLVLDDSFLYRKNIAQRIKRKDKKKFNKFLSQ